MSRLDRVRRRLGVWGGAAAGGVGRTDAAVELPGTDSQRPPAAAPPHTPNRRRTGSATSSWATFKRLFRGYVVPHWQIGLVAVAAMLVFAATQVGFAAAIRPLLDDGFVALDTAKIRLYAWLIFGLLLLQGGAYFLSHYLSGWVSRSLIKQIRLDVHDRLLSLPNAAFDQFASGRLISKLTYEAEQTASAVSRAVLIVFKDAVTVLGVLGYLLYLSPWLVLIVAFLAPLIGGLAAYINKRFRKFSRRIHRAVGGVGTIAEETVHGQREIKLFGHNARERSRFEAFNERNRREWMRFATTKFAAVPAVRLMIATTVGGLLLLVNVETIAATITVGTLASFAAALLLLNQPLSHLITLNATIQMGLTAARSLFETIDMEPEEDRGTRTVARAAGRLEFCDVHFSYDGEQPVLRGISHRVEPGQTVALTGPSGSGKSTLVSLIPRFYEPTRGEIRLDGHPLPSYRLADLRRQIAVVGQDVVLFNTTVAENIAYGSTAAVSAEAVRRAARLAYADGFIEQLDNGYETVVGEDGALLSGGQRQRIAIARAVLKDAPILILDEATSALDQESEHYIQASLDKLMVGRTTWVIAHRLSTLENADCILFVEAGEIVEAGSHRELLARNGRYADLYRIQFGGVPEGANGEGEAGR